MEKELTLVVMAAGLGSRFGGLKQMTPVTDDGRGILDFSVADAARAGFTKTVFIIREDMEAAFRETVGARAAGIMPVAYAYQDVKSLPAGRTKPFGTAHAVLCCRGAVTGPFALINADDYYGADAFMKMAKHLSSAKPGEYAMIAYALGNTLSENGAVTRGVCTVKEGTLVSVKETHGIDKKGCYEEDGVRRSLPADTPVSMNFWGLTPDIFDIAAEAWDKFLAEADLMKDEFYIPVVISDACAEGRAAVRVYESADKWYGITYKEDLPGVQAALKRYVAEGKYPHFR